MGLIYGGGPYNRGNTVGDVPFRGVENFWLRMTDFGAKNYVFDVRTLSGYISATFLSWDFIFGHNVLHHCLLLDEQNAGYA